MIVFNDIPEDAEYSVAAIRVSGVDADGVSYATALPLSVVRPLHFYYDGNNNLAEYYEPQVVHGPVIGSIGTVVTYSESHSEHRQLAVSVNINKTWAASQSQTQTSGWAEGISTTDSNSTTNSMGYPHSEGQGWKETYGIAYGFSGPSQVEFSSQNGTTWGWHTAKGATDEAFAEMISTLYGATDAAAFIGVSGEGSIPGFAKVGGSVNTEVGAKTGTTKGNTQGHRVGRSSTEGSSMSESSEEGLVYGSVTTDGVSKSISGTYGLQSQSTINAQTSQSEASSESVTFKLGGSLGLTGGVTEGSQESWSETWVTSGSDSSLLNFTSKIPSGHCAVVYRQTVRYVRRAQFYAYDLCGVRTLAAELDFNEWSWSPEIVTADGDDCASGQLPSSKLPKAYCYIACD